MLTRRAIFIVYLTLLLTSKQTFAQFPTLPEEIETLIDEANKCLFFKEYNDALRLYSNANEEVIKCVGVNNAAYAYCQVSLGVIYSNIGEYKEALNCFEEAKYFHDAGIVADKENYAILLYNIASCQYGLMDYSSAINSFNQAISDLMQCDDSIYFNTLLYLTQCYFNIGDYRSTIVVYQKLLPIVSDKYGEISESYSSVLYNMGCCYGLIGDYGNELLCYKQVEDIQQQIMGVESVDFSKTINNMGCCYANMGYYERALDCHLQNIAIREHLFGYGSQEYAETLGNVADSYRGLRNYPKAIEYLLKVLEIDSNNPYCLNNIGVLYYEMGDYSAALNYHLIALRVRESASNTKPLDIAQSLHNIGLCYYLLGDNDNSLKYLYRSVETFEDEDHPDAIKARGLIGDVYYNLGNRVMAKDYISSYCYGVEGYARHLMLLIPEQQRQNYWNQYSFFFTDKLYYYAIGLSDQEFYSTTYDGSLFGKALLLNTDIEMRKLIMESEDDEAVKMYNEIQADRVCLDKMYEKQEGGKAEIDSLNADLEKRQMELARRSKAFGDYTRNLTITWEDVRDVLNKDDIAIEFASYTSADTTYYLALTLKESYDAPHLVALFTDKEISNHNANWYSLPSSTETVWGKLKGELDGVKNVYFSPVGELNNIAIEYLPDSDGKHLISDKRNYYRLSSTRELVRDCSTEPMTDATVFGGIKYDITPNSRLYGDESTSHLLSMFVDMQYMSIDSLHIERSGWAYMPGTKMEAESIANVLGKMKVRTTLLEGEDGTEESFKALDGAKKKLIHIATHGFYYTERQARRQDNMHFMLTDESRAPQEDKMLSRSGLLFAGAANSLEGEEIPEDVEDGIVTAKDISRMDLRGCDLAVLSACQSGLGDITGDGVFGLQRGFKKAGVQTIVMSLWEVDDDATLLFMETFYKGLSAGKSKRQSFSNAVNTVRNFKGKRIIKGKSERVDYSSPKYWAAFIILDAIE